MLTAFGLQSLVYLLIAVVVAPVNYWRLGFSDRPPAISGGFLRCAFRNGVCYLPRVIESAAFETNPVMMQWLEWPAADLVSNLGVLIFPLSFAYAILRQRLFDVRVIIRRGLQYAMARRFLLALPMMAAILLLLDLIFHGNQPLFAVLKSHGAVYVAVWAVAGLAYQQRNVWLSELDRRFFRDKYDAQSLFKQVLDDIRHAANIEEVSSTVVTRVVEALHSEFCALLMRKPGRRCIA